jgi:hypothetical protein
MNFTHASTFLSASVVARYIVPLDPRACTIELGKHHRQQILTKQLSSQVLQVTSHKSPVIHEAQTKLSSSLSSATEH